jgi:Trk-type K+ transport system membrane component
VDGSETAIALSVQLLISGGLMLALTLTHSLGLIGVSKMLHLEPDVLKRRSLDMRAMITMSTLGTLLFVLHFLEILLFAIFYVVVGAVDRFESAIFYSAAAYSTLGLSFGSFPEEWRLIGAFEGLIGFILIGWSTAFMVGTMNRLRE